MEKIAWRLIFFCQHKSTVKPKIFLYVAASSSCLVSFCVKILFFLWFVFSSDKLKKKHPEFAEKRSMYSLKIDIPQKRYQLWSNLNLIFSIDLRLSAINFLSNWQFKRWSHLLLSKRVLLLFHVHAVMTSYKFKVPKFTVTPAKNIRWFFALTLRGHGFVFQEVKDLASRARASRLIAVIFRERWDLNLLLRLLFLLKKRVRTSAGKI